MRIDAVEEQLAWTTGQIALKDETLEAAAKTFNIYNRTKIQIEDPLLARHRLVGWFRLRDPESFATAAAAIADARVAKKGDVLLIVPADRAE